MKIEYIKIFNYTYFKFNKKYLFINIKTFQCIFDFFSNNNFLNLQPFQMANRD